MMVGLLVLTLRSVHAHDPKPVLHNIYGAPYAMLTAYEVRPGMEDAFLNTMVTTGPYNRVLAGFANERIIQPLASQPSAQWYISLGRYYDLSVARSVENERQAALSQLLLQPPLQLEATLVEHQLADWGWERGTTSSTLQAKPLDKEEVFEKNLSSLSFFKSGYIGQIGLLEFMPEDATLESVRAGLRSRNGLSGASIFSVNRSQLAVYSEYFIAPGNVNGQGLHISSATIQGAQAGVVVQNYVSR